MIHVHCVIKTEKQYGFTVQCDQSKHASKQLQLAMCADTMTSNYEGKWVQDSGMVVSSMGPAPAVRIASGTAKGLVNVAPCDLHGW